MFTLFDRQSMVFWTSMCELACSSKEAWWHISGIYEYTLWTKWNRRSRKEGPILLLCGWGKLFSTKLSPVKKFQAFLRGVRRAILYQWDPIHCCCLDIDTALSFFLHFCSQFRCRCCHCWSPSCSSSSCSFMITTVTTSLLNDGCPLASLLLES